MAQNDYLTQFLTDLQNRSFRPNIMDTTAPDEVKYRNVEDVLGKSIMDYAKPINPSTIVPPMLKTQKTFQASPAEVNLLKDRGSIAGDPQSFQVPVPQGPEAAATYATGLNKSLAEREKDYLQRKQDLGSVYGALKGSQTEYQDILNKIKEPAPDYTPSMDYQGELKRLGEQEQGIQDVKEDPVAKSIMMLAPAIASIFGGETGALAAPRAASAANEMYSAELKGARDENAAKRKAIAAKIESLSKMQANDVVQFSEKQKIALDRLKTTLGALEKDVSANRIYVKDEAAVVNKMYEDLNKDVMHGSDKLLDSQQKESEAERKAAEAQGKLDEAIRKNATMEEITAKKLELEKQKAELEKSKADFNAKNEAEKRRLEQERINALKNKGKGGKGAGGGKILPISAVENIANAKNALTALKDLRDLTSQNQDMFGKGTSLLGDISILTGYGDTATKAASIDADLSSKAQIIGKFLEGGKLTDADYSKYKQMVPVRGDKPAIVTNKIADLERLVQNKYNTDLSGYKSSGYNATNFAAEQVGPGLTQGVSLKGAVDPAIEQYAKAHNLSYDKALSIINLRRSKK